MDNDQDATWAFYINVDGTRMTDSVHAINTGSLDDISSTVTVILNLLQGQQVSVTLNFLVALIGAHVDQDDRLSSYFTGRLIIPT